MLNAHTARSHRRAGHAYRRGDSKAPHKPPVEDWGAPAPRPGQDPFRLPLAEIGNARRLFGLLRHGGIQAVFIDRKSVV